MGMSLSPAADLALIMRIAHSARVVLADGTVLRDSALGGDAGNKAGYVPASIRTGARKLNRGIVVEESGRRRSKNNYGRGAAFSARGCFSAMGAFHVFHHEVEEDSANEKTGC